MAYKFAMKTALSVLPFALLLACGGAQQPPPADEGDGDAPAPEAPAPATEAPDEAVAPLQLDDRWQAFLKDRFGHEASRHWVADFDGDGDDDLAVRLPNSFLFFHETAEVPPTEWEVVHLHQAEDVRVGVEAPDQARRRTERRAAGAHLLVGGDHPISLYLHAETREYAWEQIYPMALMDLVSQAQSRTPDAFTMGANRGLGSTHGEGQSPLLDWFIGDFDADGELDIVVLNGTEVVLHRTGHAPESWTSTYPARRALVVFNDRTEIASFGGDTPPLEVRGDYLALSVPEASSVALVRSGDAWQVIFRSD